jgi:hypothetical protein
MAVKDAVAYLRNTQIIANAALGVAMEQLLVKPVAETQSALVAIGFAHGSVLMATDNLQAVGVSVHQVLGSFPRTS